MPALKLKDKDGNWIPLPTIKGADGKSAYQQAVEAGYTGTEAAFYAALVSLKDGPFLPTAGGTVEGWADFDVIRVKSIGSAHTDQSYVNIPGGIWVDGSRIRSVAVPEAVDDAANKQYVDSKTLVFSGKTIATTAWVFNSTYSAQGYAYRASVACAGVTTSHRPDVAFSAADAVSGNFAPVADSYAGGVYIYCKEKPTATVTIPSIVCVKGA